MDANELLPALIKAYRVVGHSQPRAQELAIVALWGAQRGLITLASVWCSLFNAAQRRG